MELGRNASTKKKLLIPKVSFEDKNKKDEFLGKDQSSHFGLYCYIQLKIFSKKYITEFFCLLLLDLTNFSQRAYFEGATVIQRQNTKITLKPQTIADI